MKTLTHLIRRAFAPVKIPARDWTFEVLDSDDTTYLAIGGLTTFSPGSTKNDTDATTFDSAGWLEHQTMSRSGSLTLEGFRLEDTADGSQDPGQKRLEDVSREIGASSLVTMRVTSPGGTVYSWSVSVDMNPLGTEGGGNDDFSGFRAALTMSGQVTIT